MRFFNQPNPGVEAAEVLRQKYRNVFNSAEGHEVLTDIMVRLHFFDEVVSPEESILANFARHLLSLMGVYQGMNAQRIIQAFLGFPVRAPREKE